MVGASFGAVGFAGTDDVDDFGLDVSGGSPMFEVLQPSRSARVEFVERFLAQVVMELLANVQATPASGPLARKCKGAAFIHVLSLPSTKLHSDKHHSNHRPPTTPRAQPCALCV